MVRLRRVSPDEPGWTRRRAGRGFVHLDEDGNRLDEADAQRVRDLVVPPAWTDVWISPHPNAHLQAVGTDDAGRRQYLYHPAWRERQDASKFARVRELGAVLPAVRSRLAEDVAADDPGPEWACALAVLLLDQGFFRIGGGEFGEDSESFGLTTLERRHVRCARSRVSFEFTGKSGVEQRVTVEDVLCVPAIRRLRRRRGSFENLLAYKESGRWQPLTAATVNEYIREVTGLEVSAKDFRTWHATVLAAVALAASEETGSRTARKRAVSAAMKEVADYLGNTPAVARSSYVDPRVVDHFEEGRTVVVPSGQDLASVLREDRARVEAEVLDLLG